MQFGACDLINIQCITGLPNSDQISRFDFVVYSDRVTFMRRKKKYLNQLKVTTSYESFKKNKKKLKSKCVGL